MNAPDVLSPRLYEIIIMALATMVGVFLIRLINTVDSVRDMVSNMHENYVDKEEFEKHEVEIVKLKDKVEGHSILLEAQRLRAR